MRETWIVGVSGGPDSMALLHYLKHQGFRVVAAHVNYQKRDTSNRDEEVVSKYCLKHDIEFEVRYFEDIEKGNFQAKARDFRYSFFKDLRKKYSDLGINQNNINTIVGNYDMCMFLEKIINNINPVIGANILTGEISSYLNKNKLEFNNIKLTVDNFQDLVNRYGLVEEWI